MFHLWFCLILLDVKINLYQCHCQCQYVNHQLAGTVNINNNNFLERSFLNAAPHE